MLDLKKMNSEEIVKLFTSKSQCIRYLLSKGYDRSTVAKMLNIRYQHVRNVELQITKKVIEDPKISDVSEEDTNQLSFDM
jgi:hypothetical protein